MGLSGLWASRAARDYTGATRWGTGVNPIHAVRDISAGRGQIKENLYPLGDPTGPVSDTLLARDIDMICEDYVDVRYPGESYRYQDEHPRWDQRTEQFRGQTNSPAMGEQPAWGVYYQDPDDPFPLGGPTGGTQQWLDVDHGEVAEQLVAIATPTPMVTGGWRSKSRGSDAHPDGVQELTQPGYQWTLNTAAVQGPGLKSRSNERAVARGTDEPRASIPSRTAGMAEKDYASSFGMGGGPATPDMRPVGLTAGLKRPWFGRTAALPPDEVHFMNTMEGRSPLARSMPSDPYQGDPEAGAGDRLAAAADWGY